ncbi:hypothetical protein HPP92_018745 [Vanilla planifolia]|uniref:Protein kinase domain-containing protein n=1 Tax=Vanilla planifolia TaxID=51239 RepID=A0A835Q6A2_VANPL|nr:hypothetical protein HPP92_018745 [Vanilla planifolia]
MKRLCAKGGEDIKGANLLVDVNGVVKLADFGMAKHLNGAAPALSLKELILMAPEAAAMFKVLHKDPTTPEALSSEGKTFYNAVSIGISREANSNNAT